MLGSPGLEDHDLQPEDAVPAATDGRPGLQAGSPSREVCAGH